MKYIQKQLRTLAVPIDSIEPDPRNARVHGQKNMRAIKASYRRYGQRKPIVVNSRTNYILAGNGTWQAFKDMGYKHIAVVFVDDDPKTATGYAIADNRSAELAEWDLDVLSEIMKEDDFSLDDFDDLGFSNDEVKKILRDPSLDEDGSPVDSPGFDGDQEEDEGPDEELLGAGAERFVSFEPDQWEVVVEAAGAYDMADFLTQLCKRYTEEGQ